MDDPMILSSSRFYRRIIRKYQRGKRNLFRFPMMIFLKNTGQALSQKINVNIRILLHFHNRSISSTLIEGSVQNIKRLFSWFEIERFFPVDNVTFSGVFSQHGNTETALYKIHHTLISATSAFQRIKHPFQETGGNLKKTGRAAVVIKCGIEPGISWSYSSSGKENPCEYKFMLEHEFPAVSSQVNLFLNNRVFSGRTLYSQEDRKVHAPVEMNMQLAVNYARNINPFSLSVFERRPTSERVNFPPVDMRIHNVVFYPYENHYLSSSRMAARQHGIFGNFAPIIYPGRYSTPVLTSHAVSPRGTSSPDRFPGAAIYPLKTLSVLPDQEKVNRLSGIHGGYAGIMDPGYGFAVEPGFRSVRLQVISSQNIMLMLYKAGSRIGRIHQKPLTFIKPVIKQANYKFDPGAAGVTQLKKENPFKDDTNLHFRNDRKIEQEIEQIKKITEEVKRTVIEKTLPAEVSRVVDVRGKINIGQLSDEVYQIIDRRIKIEKERRGYI